MVQLLLDYKPGCRTLSNVIKLCQTLGLESFVDQVDSTKSRLSIASKIVVIDIDYEKEMETILDVKLVLASNFDRFNYFNENGDNILLKSLSDSRDLKAFHHNLNFLVFLDSYSNIDIESGHTSLDLFKYYSDLPKMLQDFLDDQQLPFSIKVNENDTFGINIYDTNGIVMSVAMQKTNAHDKPFYEYIYYPKLKEWINESSDASTLGIALGLRFKNYIAFPESWIVPELIADADYKKFELPNQSQVIKSIKLQNEFTSDLLLLKRFFISNDDISLLPDFLKWYQWHEMVLQQTLRLISNENVSVSNSNENKQRRRSSVISNRRPSLTDSMMLRDSGIPQFTLKEILDQPVFSDLEENAMEIDNTQQMTLVINEEYVYFGKLQKCTYHDDDISKWQLFTDFVKTKI